MPTKGLRMLQNKLLHKVYQVSNTILTLHNVVYDTGNML